jgi:hypothetical protein
MKEIFPLKSRRGGVILACFFLFVGGGYWIGKRPLAPQGGVYFIREVRLLVPHFRQGDEKWRGDTLAWGPTTMGAEGCAVASAAMVLGSYGCDLDPGRLNLWLQQHQGYTEQGWLYWEKAAAMFPQKAEHVYEDQASYFWIDWNLWRGNPVIIRLRFAEGKTHFVVIMGKHGWDYLIVDPGQGWKKGVYPLAELGRPIEALRFYRKL